ncbi:MAG: Gfo/Idh/MocA family protein [Anaerolineae bacterium]
MASVQPVKVGIVGLGRAGWGLHGRTFQIPAVAEKFQVVAVTDPIKARMEEAQQAFGCRAHPSFEALLGDKEVELVAVATFNKDHARHSIAALQAGKHVISEKPMATSLADADRMVQVAKETGRILTVDHNMRFLPGVAAMRAIVDSGILGEIVLIHINGHSYRRRWDWQTLKSFDGGEMNNNASHAVDLALQLLGGADVKVTSDLRRTALCAGDAEDHVKIVLTTKGGPTVDIEVTNACAFGQEPWLIMGTYGSLAGSPGQFRIKYVDPKLLPTLTPDPEPTPDRGYNREELPWREETWSRGSDNSGGYDLLYLDLYETIRNGKPLAITPESVRKVIAVLEECRRQSPLYQG